MKTKFKKYKGFIRWGAMIPIVIIIPDPLIYISLIFLSIQLTCFGLMCYIGWGFD